jgi:hypothetical protein
MPIEKHIPLVWWILVFFIAMTALFHFLSIHTSKGKPKNFVLYYTGASALRLVLYTMLIIIYRFYDKDTLIPFATGFLVHYFLFTVFEVPVLLTELKATTPPFSIHREEG